LLNSSAQASTRGITVVEPATVIAAASVAGAASFSSSTHPEKDRIETIAKEAIKKGTNGLFIKNLLPIDVWYKSYRNGINR
jgi:hypothetical protein